MQPQVLFIKEVADLFGCSTKTIRNNIGKPSKRYPQPRNVRTKTEGERYEWLRSDVEKFLKREELPDTDQIEAQSRIRKMIEEVVDERLSVLFGHAKAG